MPASSHTPKHRGIDHESAMIQLHFAELALAQPGHDFLAIDGQTSIYSAHIAAATLDLVHLAQLPLQKHVQGQS